MKKEYHLTITRKDRIYLVIFVSALLGWELIKLVIPFPKEVQENKAEERLTEALLSDSTTDSKKVKDTSDFLKKEMNSNEAETLVKEELAPIPIMTASVDQLIKLGFSKKIAFTIQKYIQAGGQIRDVKSLSKIYGIDTNEIQDIIPFLIFSAKPGISESVDSTSMDRPNHKSTTVFDLNVASPEDLESLPLIGAVLADRIIKFRTALGGFTSIEQIKECYGLKEETFDLIKPRLTLIEPAQQFSINAVDPKTFSHPYLNKKILWMLPSYIKNHGSIKNEEELKKVFPPDSNWCKKLLPYIKFD